MWALAAMTAFAGAQGSWAQDRVPFATRTTSSQLAQGAIIQGRQVPVWRLEGAPAPVYRDDDDAPPAPAGLPPRQEGVPDGPTPAPQGWPDAVSTRPARPRQPIERRETVRVAQAPASAEGAARDASPGLTPPAVGQETVRPPVATSRPRVAPATQPAPAVATAGRRSAPREGQPASDFAIVAGQRLSTALHDFLSANRMRMQWNTRVDYVIQHPYRIDGSAFQDTLREVLSAYGLSATIWEGNNVVEIYSKDGEAPQ